MPLGFEHTGGDYAGPLPESGYAIGQVFEHRLGGELVVVGEVRPPDHPKGNGLMMALAVPYVAGLTVKDCVDQCHIFDTVILCRDQPSHGDEVWRLTDLKMPQRG